MTNPDKPETEAAEATEELSIHDRLEELEARVSHIEEHAKIEQKPRAKSRKK